MIAFRLHNRHIRFVLPLPDRHDRSFTHTPHGSEAHGAVRRPLIRAGGTAALALVTKAKLEAAGRKRWLCAAALVAPRMREATARQRVRRGSTWCRYGLVLIPLSHSCAVAGHRYETGMPLVCVTLSQGARTDVDNPF